MNRDGTGPEGKGALTGRKKGSCKSMTESVQKSIELLTLLDNVDPYDFEKKEEIINKLDDLRIRLRQIILINYNHYLNR